MKGIIVETTDKVLSKMLFQVLKIYVIGHLFKLSKL